MELHQSAEDYLEAILMIKEKKGYVRSIDVANQLGVSKPSVSYATKRLRENGYISFNEDGMIALTDSDWKAWIQIQQSSQPEPSE